MDGRAFIMTDRSNMRRATQAEVEYRVNQVYLLIMSGADAREIYKYAEAQWQISTRQADNYIRKAKDQFEDLADTVRKQELGKALARLNDLYKRNLKINDFKAALAVQKEIDTLLGLHAIPDGANTYEIVIRHEHAGDYLAEPLPAPARHRVQPG